LNKGIEVKRVFFVSYEMILYNKYINQKEIFSNSRFVSTNGLSLPSFASLARDSLDKIISIIEKETL
jgi:dTDP-4-amino-4,6-dideoxygalactose transaminase